MLLVVEIAMLIGGIVAIVTAKVPGFLVGGGKYQVEGATARLFGVLLLLPLPIAFFGALILALLFGEEGAGYATILELVTVVGIAILAVVLIRVVGKKVEPVNDIEATIAKKAQGALMYAIFSATGFAAVICCPLAFVYANQALKLIDENNIGEQYRGKAKTARIIAGVATLLWIVAVLCFISVLFPGS
ncbi:MAG: hypothetical protein ACK2U1_16160 [Anaerolineales bacterium]